MIYDSPSQNRHAITYGIPRASAQATACTRRRTPTRNPNSARRVTVLGDVTTREFRASAKTPACVASIARMAEGSSARDAINRVRHLRDQPRRMLGILARRTSRWVAPALSTCRCALQAGLPVHVKPRRNFQSVRLDVLLSACCADNRPDQCS